MRLLTYEEDEELYNMHIACWNITNGFDRKAFKKFEYRMKELSEQGTNVSKYQHILKEYKTIFRNQIYDEQRI